MATTSPHTQDLRVSRAYGAVRMLDQGEQLDELVE